MEKQLNSSGISSQDLRHCRFFKRSRMFYKSGTLNLRNSQAGSSSCQCSTILIGQAKETMRFVFRTQKKKVKTYAKNFSQGHWTFLGPGDEKKWYGKSKYLPEGKWNFVASQMVQRLKGTGHPVFTSASALSRGILRTLKGKETIHFQCGCFKHRTLVPNHSFCKSAPYLRSRFELV